MPPTAIDIHHHYVPAELLEEARRHGRSLGVELTESQTGEKALSFAGAPPFVLHPDLPAVEARLAMMQDCKLARAALEAHTATLGYQLTGEQGESWCRLYNEGIRALIKRHPERFTGIAAVPLQDPPRAAQVLEHAIRDLGLRGGYIGSNVNGKYYNTHDFDPFWRKAEELDALIVMHPEDVAGAERMGPYGLKLICGNPADSALSLGFMTYSGIFDRFPNLKLCVLHGGGFFPYHLGRFDQGWHVRSGARAAQAQKPPSGYLKNLYYDNMIYRVDTLDYLRRLAGADHIMVGTDYPYSLGDWKAVDKIEALDCPDAEKRLMLDGNAKRLLKL
ncbi:MAG TPA: amidohydrolase family protein [Candidatus Eisenbacteria bacterium]|nr:amidohydrolase family protein [Candidatus Eisenbacteria bacterium]